MRPRKLFFGAGAAPRQALIWKLGPQLLEHGIEINYHDKRKEEVVNMID